MSAEQWYPVCRGILALFGGRSHVTSVRHMSSLRKGGRARIRSSRISLRLVCIELVGERE